MGLSLLVQQQLAAELDAVCNIQFYVFQGHPDIVKAIGLIQEAGALGRSIVLELATHGSLARFLSHLKANKCASLLHSICRSLSCSLIDKCQFACRWRDWQ